MAALHPVLVVTDVPINGSGAPASHIVASVEEWSITWSIGKPETISYRAVGQDAATYLTPGVAPTGTRIVGPSLDNGTSQESRMLGGAAQWNLDNYPTISESGNGLGQVLATARIARVSFQQVTFGDVLTAAAGTIRTTSGRTLLPVPILPSVSGVGTLPIGPIGTTQGTALAFSYVVDPAITALVLDLDVNRDTRLRSLENVTEHLGSAADPSRAQFVIDSGDFGVIEGSARAQTVTIGHKGDASRLTFTSAGTGFPTQLMLLGSSGSTQVADQCRSCSIIGGDTHHGMPDGGQITAIKTVNRIRLVDTGDPAQGIPLVGIYKDRDHGGVYVWLGDGALHPVSQAMGVKDLWYSETGDSAGIITAATDAGAYQAWATNPLDATSVVWNRLGTMALAVSKLCRSQGVLYALVAYHDGSTHILRYPAAAGASTGHGYDGWSPAMSTTGIADFGVAEGVLYYIRSAAGSAAVVHRAVLPGGTAPTLPTQLPIPNQGTPGDTVATGIDVVTLNDDGANVVGLFVRTTRGSTGLYYIDPFLAPALYPAGAGLVDDANQPVMVNKITAHCGTAPGFTATENVVAWPGGLQTRVEVWASTNRGMYASLRGVGFFAWRPTGGQSNLGDIDVQAVAAAPPRTILGQLQTKVYAITPRTIYESADGTLHFVDMFNQPLDAGPAFWALWLKTYGQYPTTSDSTLNYPDAASGPFTIIRQINKEDGLGQVEYIAVNPASTAPAWAHRDTEIVQISASALVPEIPLSQLLLDAMCRFLTFTADPQEHVIAESSFKDTADPLRTLRPTQLVLVNGPVKFYKGSGEIVYRTYVNEPFYVLEHTIRVTGTSGQGEGPNRAHTSTKLGKLLIDDRTDPMRVTADMMYAISRQQLYKSRGHK